ncbi:MAG: ELWxxDGT repeat protein, partial [Candidatus Sigynarchaeota archaeon]
MAKDRSFITSLKSFLRNLNPKMRVLLLIAVIVAVGLPLSLFLITSNDNGKTPSEAIVTSLLKDIDTYTSSSEPGTFVIFNNMLYFSAFNSTHGRELWKTDGTTAGTAMVKDINVGTGGSQITELIVFNGALYF